MPAFAIPPPIRRPCATREENPVQGGAGFWRRPRDGEIAADRLPGLAPITGDMPGWEMHPTSDLAIVPRATRHRFVCREAGALLFVTCGGDTRHRPLA